MSIMLRNPRLELPKNHSFVFIQLNDPDYVVKVKRLGLPNFILVQFNYGHTFPWVERGEFGLIFKDNEVYGWVAAEDIVTRMCPVTEDDLNEHDIGLDNT